MNGKQAKALHKAARKITEGQPEIQYKTVRQGRKGKLRLEVGLSTRGIMKKLKKGFKQERQRV